MFASLGRGLSAALLLVAACAAPVSPTAEPAPALDAVTVPADFTFATTRPLTLKLAVPAGLQAAVQVRTPDGRVVRERPAGASGPASLRVAVPSDTGRVDVVVRSADGAERVTSVAVPASGVVEHQVEG